MFYLKQPPIPHPRGRQKLYLWEFKQQQQQQKQQNTAIKSYYALLTSPVPVF